MAYRFQLTLTLIRGSTTVKSENGLSEYMKRVSEVTAEPENQRNTICDYNIHVQHKTITT